ANRAGSPSPSRPLYPRMVATESVCLDLDFSMRAGPRDEPERSRRDAQATEPAPELGCGERATGDALDPQGASLGDGFVKVRSNQIRDRDGGRIFCSPDGARKREVNRADA